MFTARIALLACLLMAGTPAWSWWNEDWQFRKVIAVDAGATGLALTEPATDVPVLVRLHMGNFGYFMDLRQDAADLRFFADEDATPLAHYVERFDPANRIAMIWVKLPRLAPGQVQQLRMYYGNPDAPAAENAAGVFDRGTVLALDFSGAEGLRDRTAYGLHPVRADVLPESAGLIADGARFAGNQRIELPPAPPLAYGPEQGRTVSFWLRLEREQADAVLIDQDDGTGGRIRLRAEGRALVVEQLDAVGEVTSSSAAETLLPIGEWTHVALVLDAAGARTLLGGASVAEAPVGMAAGASAIVVGEALGGGQALDGALMDALRVANQARTDDWLRVAVVNQGMESLGVALGADESRDAGKTEGHFVTTLRNVHWVSLEGIVIFICVFMAIYSLYVIYTKGVNTERIRSANTRFLDWYRSRDALAEPEPADATADRFDPSTLAEIYALGLNEIDRRLARAGAEEEGALNARSTSITRENMDAVRSILVGQNVRISQRMNSLMVLLTLAIAGGPFLGLLGTVVGVMVTFAGIAASGDVNISAIAPGIAAALVATVAGLGVAIPALFGYNYIGSRLKEVITDNNVFLEEFMSAAIETYVRAR